MRDAKPGREQTSSHAKMGLQEAAPCVGLVLGRRAKLSSQNRGGSFASPPGVVAAQGSLEHGQAVACESPAKGNAKMPRRSAHFCCRRLQELRLGPAPPRRDFGTCFQGGGFMHPGKGTPSTATPRPCSCQPLPSPVLVAGLSPVLSPSPHSSTLGAC